MSGSKGRTIKLYCPSVSKIVQLAASEEQRLDLGLIARAFGLDPSTLRLNGHFISRGVDLIASSVTWKSLLSFFSAKGLSTGKHDADALIVDGKLSKVGTKSKFTSQFFRLLWLIWPNGFCPLLCLVPEKTWFFPPLFFFFLIIMWVVSIWLWL